MKKLNAKIETGTRVMMNGTWYVIDSIRMGRKLCKLVGMYGEFQAAHFSKFTNRDLGAKEIRQK